VKEEHNSNPQGRYDKAQEKRREKLRAQRTNGPVAISLDDFYAYMPMHNYIYAPSREMWPGASINNRIPPSPLLDASGAPKLNKKGEPVFIAASTWIDQNRPVEQMTWAPGLPMVIENRLISQGGWIKHKGAHCFNQYRAPSIEPGDPEQAALWLDHVQNVFGTDSHHIVQWLAHRVQRPADKINHALVLGGLQGIGKDTMLEPVKYAVGPWNFLEASPQQMLGRFNGFLKSVILRVSEARDLGEVNRFQFYDHLKAYTAAPPDVLRIDEKNLREYSIFNCCGNIITINYKTDGIFLPEDDRRHYVAWSDLDKADFNDDYWNRIWSYYLDQGGLRHVAAYLAQLDIGGFNAKSPPTKTEAFWSIVNASRSSEDAELADILELLGNPNATTLKKVIARADTARRDDFKDWLKDRRNRRLIPHRFEACGYVPVRNPDRQQKSGVWVIGGERQVVYAKQVLSLRDQIAAAGKL
jgi:hypothetical protein